MIPKLETAIAAVEAGVESAVILDGRRPHAMLVELFTEHGAGTLVTGLSGVPGADLQPYRHLAVRSRQHPLSARVRPHGCDIESGSPTYVERLTGLPRDEARALQKRYLRRARPDAGAA